MDKKTLFILAMKAGEYKRKAFVITAFSLVHESPDAWKKDPYPYRIVQLPTGMFFVNPQQNNELSKIDDSVLNQPLFGIKETVSLAANEVENLTENVETTYGKILFNYIALINSFGNKIPYVNQRVTPGKVEEMILPKFVDYPEPPKERNDSDIYIDEYIKFCDAMFYLAGFAQLCVPAATEKTMTAAPGINELKAKLLKEYEGRLNDPEVIAIIDAELVKFDKEYLKGDLGEGFLIKDDSYSKVRKKLFSMHGAEYGLVEKAEVDLIQNSLSEGWDINAFPAMNNSLRAGSFNRGAETMKGGEAFKWLQRASSNINVTTEDCGSKLGNSITVSDQNIKWVIGFSIVTTSGSKLIANEEEARALIGKTVSVRSPMYCNVPETDFCHVCVGKNLSNNPTGLSVAITGYGSVMMNIMLKSMHGSALQLARMDYKEAIF